MLIRSTITPSTTNLEALYTVAAGNQLAFNICLTNVSTGACNVTLAIGTDIIVPSSMLKAGEMIQLTQLTGLPWDVINVSTDTVNTLTAHIFWELSVI